MTKLEKIALAIFNKVTEGQGETAWADMSPEEREDALEWARAGLEAARDAVSRDAVSEVQAKLTYDLMGRIFYEHERGEAGLEIDRLRETEEILRRIRDAGPPRAFIGNAEDYPIFIKGDDL